jgi:hypothetical protein
MYIHVTGIQRGDVVFCDVRAEVEEIPDDSNTTTETSCLL